MNLKKSGKCLMTILCLVMGITTLLPKLTTFSYHVQFEQSKTIWGFNLIFANYFPKFMIFSALVQFKQFDVI